MLHQHSVFCTILIVSVKVCTHTKWCSTKAEYTDIQKRVSGVWNVSIDYSKNKAQVQLLLITEDLVNDIDNDNIFIVQICENLICLILCMLFLILQAAKRVNSMTINPGVWLGLPGTPAVVSFSILVFSLFIWVCWWPGVGGCWTGCM